MKPHSAAGDAPASIITGMTTMAGVPGRQDRGEDDRARPPGAEQELALGADVPEAHPEGERAGQPGQDQRRRLDQRVADDPDAAERGDHDVAERPDRIATDEPDDEAAQDEGEGQGGKGHQRREPARRVGPRLEAEGHGRSRSRRSLAGRRRRRRRRAAGHQQADLVDVGRRRIGNEPTIRPSYMTTTRSDSDRISSSSSEISTIATPGRAPLEQDPVDRLDRADVEPARRLDGDHHPRLRIDLAGEDEPLQVAARQEPGLRVDRRRGDGVLVLESLGQRCAPPCRRGTSRGRSAGRGSAS